MRYRGRFGLESQLFIYREELDYLKEHAKSENLDI